MNMTRIKLTTQPVAGPKPQVAMLAPVFLFASPYRYSLALKPPTERCFRLAQSRSHNRVLDVLSAMMATTPPDLTN